MRRMPFFFEPWRAWRDTTWDISFRLGPPKIDDEEVIAKWHASRDRAEQDAKVVLFGSALWEPSVVTTIYGEPQAHEGAGIVATLHPIHTDHPKPADHVQLAVRIVECVNACAGMPSPVKTLEQLRLLLSSLARGVTDASDPRIVRLLDQLCPSEDYVKLQKRISGSEET